MLLTRPDDANLEATQRAEDDTRARIIADFARVIDRDPRGHSLHDINDLPHSKQCILDALLTELEIEDDAASRDRLSTCALALADFQRPVGAHGVGPAADSDIMLLRARELDGIRGALRFVEATGRQRLRRSATALGDVEKAEGGRAMDNALLWFIRIWVGLVIVVNLAAVAGIIVTATSFGEAWSQVTMVFSPFNLVNVAMELLFLSPALAAAWWLDRRRSNALRLETD